MGSLTLLAVTLCMMERKRPFWYTGAPVVFMLMTTLVAMAIKMRDFWMNVTYLLLVLGVGIFVISVWLAVEAALRISKRESPADLGET